MNPKEILLGVWVSLCHFTDEETAPHLLGSYVSLPTLALQASALAHTLPSK
jgi:hypothetical protein